MEFLKFSCIRSVANQRPYEFCSNHLWVGPACERVPCPMPDYEVLPKYHYKHVNDISVTIFL